MSNFEPNAIIRGAQLTVVGAYRALQNPSLFKSEHYKQALLALCAGILIHLILSIPIALIKSSIWMLSWLINLQDVNWDNKVIETLDFVSTYVLEVPFLLMTLMRYISPTLDDLFMESLRWVDSTYMQKHKSDDPSGLRAMYYPNLVMYSTKSQSGPKSRKDIYQSVLSFLSRYGRRTAISLAVYLCSLLPVVGHFVLPAASFYTFRKAVGATPAIAIFASGLVVPKKFLVVFLRSYFSSRSLMRELLEPYFSRIKYTKEQKKRWFLDREGVLFGFGLGFYLMIKPRMFGVLVYGIAEASTAYLITKITDPPPPPAYSEGFAESQVHWTNKHDFLKLSLDKLDHLNINTATGEEKSREEVPRMKFS